MHFSRLLCLLALSASVARAQTNGTTANGKTVISAGRTVYTSKGVRLETARGVRPRVQTPQLDVQAQTIALDTANNTLTEARAVGQVRIDVRFPPSNGQTSRVQATCNSAVLQPASRTLTLSGNVSGFYQVGQGAQNTLRGDKAVLQQQANGQISANVTGARGITLTVPAETVNADNTQAALGPITITARQLVTGSDNTVRFTGNARAVSRGGPNAFDVRATEFVLTRASDGSIGQLTTTGRTRITIDLPPDPAPANVAPSQSGLLKDAGRPTRVTAEADSATVTRADQSLLLTGNVTGTYRLSPPNKVPGEYEFSGERALLRYNPTAQGETLAGFSVDVTGRENKPVLFTAPELNLGF